MKADRSLKRILEDLSISLSEDGEMRDIELTEDGRAGSISPEGDIKIHSSPIERMGLEDEIDISKEQEFGLIVDTESHEIEHDHVSDLNAKKKMSEEYPRIPRLAGFIWNVIEDVYIDKRRTERDRGLRPVHAFHSELIYRVNDPITESEPPEKHAEAVLHIGKAGGTPVGFDQVEDDEFKEYCTKVRKVIDKVEDAHTQKERYEIVDEIVDLIDEYAELQEMPELEIPQSMPMAMSDEEMDGDGDPLPEPNEEFADPDMFEDSQDDSDENGEDGQQMSMSGIQTGDSDSESDSDGGTKQEQEQQCPECGSKSVSNFTNIVDGMVAARCNAPFSVNSNWVRDISFIEDNEVCGFKIKHNGEYPQSVIENNGYLVDEISSAVIEVLEPKSRYDDKEEVKMNQCDSCGNEWLPNIDL